MTGHGQYSGRLTLWGPESREQKRSAGNCGHGEEINIEREEMRCYFATAMFKTAVLPFRCALALALVVVTVLALSPAPDLPLALWDKANHTLAYFFLAFLADRSFPQAAAQMPHKAGILALFIYGLLIEALQSQIPFRQASALDVLANASGLALYLAAHRISRGGTSHAG